MLNQIFSSILTSDGTTTLSISGFLICTICSLIFGAVISWIFSYKNTYTKSFVMTLALLPAIVQIVIMLVNGNLGTGVAVMGAFSLIRFRSVPGSAREICSIFFAMAVGLATGIGYLAIAAVFVLIIGGVSILYTATQFGEPKQEDKTLKITIPESLDYTGAFDDLFQTYTNKVELVEVKTTNMGSLFKLAYRVQFKHGDTEKQFLDELRCRNGNLEIICSRLPLEQSTM